MPRSQPQGGSHGSFAKRDKHRRAIADQCRGHTADSRLMLPVTRGGSHGSFATRNKHRRATAANAPRHTGRQPWQLRNAKQASTRDSRFMLPVTAAGRQFAKRNKHRHATATYAVGHTDRKSATPEGAALNVVSCLDITANRF